MLVYYILNSILVFTGIYAGNKNTKQNTIFYLVLSVLLLTVLASFRYAIGFDYFSYRRIYENIEGLSFNQVFLIHKKEFLFYILCKICNCMNLPYTGFLFIVSLFMHSVAMWFIHRCSKIPWLSVYLYITLQFFAHNMNLIRQSMALSFFLLAFPFLKKRKIVPFLLIIIAGSLCHNSVFFMLPLYFLLPIKANVKSMGVLLGLTLIAYILCEPLLECIMPLLSNAYSAYSSSEFWQASTFDYVIMPFIYFILLFLFRNKYGDDGKDSSFYLNGAFYTFAITLFITKHFILERLAIYPNILSIIAIPDLITCYYNNEKSKNTLLWKRKVCYVLALFLIYGGITFLFSAHKGIHHVYPYISLLDKAKSPG